VARGPGLRRYYYYYYYLYHHHHKQQQQACSIVKASSRRSRDDRRLVSRDSVFSQCVRTPLIDEGKATRELQRAEPTFGDGWYEEEVEERGGVAVTHHRHLVGVAAERGDVLADVVQSCDEVEQRVVPRGAVVRQAQETCNTIRTRRCFQCGSVPLRSDIKGTELPLPIYWYHSKDNWVRYNFAAESFYIMKLCSRLFVLYCRNCPKDDKFRYFIPILRKLGAA